MRKKISLILSIALIITFLVPLQGFAQYDKGLEEAILKAKSLFSITEEYDKFNYSINSYGGTTEYYLDWSDSGEKLPIINVSIDSKGFVRSYSSYERNYQEPQRKLPDISKNEAIRISNDFIKRINPEISGNLELVENNEPLNVNSRYYSIKYIRKENGVPYQYNTVNVSVDNVTGKVQSFYCNWNSELKFDSPEGVISLEEAQKIFKDEIGLKLVYRLDYNSEEIKPYLVYTVLNNNKTIDAKTGEVISYSPYYYAYDTAEKEMITGDRGSNGLSPEELEAVKNTADIITQDEAEKLARKYLNIDSSYKVRYINLYTEWRNKDDFTWNISFYKSEKEFENSLSISIDAKTEEIKSFYKYIPYDSSKEVKYDKDKALEIAKDYIKSIQPDKYKMVEYIEQDEPVYIPLDSKEIEKPRQYYFNFTRVENGAYFEGDGFNVTVDTVNGEISQYNYNWYKKELPSTENIVSFDKAYEVLFGQVGMELNYITDYEYGYYEKYGNEQEKDATAKLVYSIKRDKPLNIDPITGKLMYYYNRPYEEKTIAEYSDIADSYAKSEIETLAQFGISLPGDKFMPQNTITQRDYLYLLAKANYYYLDLPYDDKSKLDENLYRYLANEGIVREGEKAPDSVVTKEDAVKFLVRALKFGKVADIKGIYAVPFKDVTSINEDLIGYVAIAYGLDIVKGSDDGYFNPQNNLTREQAAIVIYNYLNIN